MQNYEKHVNIQILNFTMLINRSIISSRTSLKISFQRISFLNFNKETCFNKNRGFDSLKIDIDAKLNFSSIRSQHFERIIFSKRFLKFFDIKFSSYVYCNNISKKFKNRRRLKKSFERKFWKEI